MAKAKEANDRLTAAVTVGKVPLKTVAKEPNLLDQAIAATTVGKVASILTDDPLDSAERLGKWLHSAGMVKTPGAGAILAMCSITRGIDLLRFVSEHSVIMGTVTRDYDMFLCDLREAGEDYEWVSTGDAGDFAELKWTWKGRGYSYEFSMEMAIKAKLVKPDSNWEKYPGNMLRSKCVRHGFKLYCPDLIRGLTTPEDAADIGDAEKARADKPKPKPKRKTSQASDAKADDGAKNLPLQDQPEVDKQAAVDEKAKQSPAVEIAPASMLKEIIELGSQITNSETGNAFTVAEIAAQIRESYDCEPQALPVDKAEKLIAQFRAFIAKK